MPLYSVLQRSKETNLIAALDLMSEYISKERFTALQTAFGIENYGKEAVRGARVECYFKGSTLNVAILADVSGKGCFPIQ